MGWNSQNVTNLLIIQAGQGFTGLFIYSPSVGPGNLIGSWAGQAGTDPYGNAYNQNLSTYGSQTIINQPVPVQQTSGTNSGASSLTLTFPNNTTAGNVLAVRVATSSTLTNATVSGITIGGSADNFAAQFTEGTSTDAGVVTIWIDTNCLGGHNNIVITTTGGTGTQTILATAQEWNGISNSSPLDATSGGLNDALTNTAWSSGVTATTVQAVEVALGATYSDSISGLTINPPSFPWFNQAQVSNGITGFLTGYQILATIAGPRVIQTAFSTGFTNSLTITLSSPTTAGNCLVLAIAIGNFTITGVTLGGSADNWVAGPIATDSGSNHYLFWVDQNCAGGQTSIVISVSGSGTITGQAYEVAGTFSPIDQTSTGNGAGGTTWSSGATPNTSQASEIAFGMAAMFAGSAPTITGPAGWTNTTQAWGGSGSFISGYQVQTTVAAITYSGTNTPAVTDYGSAVLTLRGTGLFYAGTVTPASTFVSAVASFKASAPTVTIHPQIVEQELGGVLTKAFFTMAQSELAPAAMHAEIVNPGRQDESIVFFVFGPRNSISPDFAEIDLFGSPNNQPNAATGFLSYRTAAGVYQRMLAWGLQGVSRYSPAGMNGGIALMQADGFARTVTQTTPTPITFNYTIPASDQAGLINVTYRIKTFGGGTQGSTAQAVGFQINAFGANWAPLTVPATFAAINAAFSWESDLFITVVTTGSSGTATSGGHVIINGSAFAVHGSRATINTTVQSTIDLLVSWGSATGAPTITAEASQLFREEP